MVFDGVCGKPQKSRFANKKADNNDSNSDHNNDRDNDNSQAQRQAKAGHTQAVVYWFIASDSGSSRFSNTILNESSF